MFNFFKKLLGAGESLTKMDKIRELLTEGAHLVDVRTPQEFNQGHIPGAINIPLSNFENSAKISGKPVILYCRSGMRSGIAMKKLRKQGRTDVYNMGGINRWST